MRISFTYDPCDYASVCAQLIKDNRGEFTLEQWDPDYAPKKHQIELWESSICAWIICFLPMLFKNCCMGDYRPKECCTEEEEVLDTTGKFGKYMDGQKTLK